MAGELEAAGKGALSGAMTGASLGSMVPGVGNALGAGVGAVLGGASSAIKAGRASKADEAIQAQDPQELARLAEIDRIRKSIGAGTDALTQQQIQQAQQTGAATQERIARSTGGDVGATITGLTRAQRGTQAATNQALAGAQQRLPFFENMGQQLRTRVSQRALEVGLQRRDQAMAEKAAQARANSANIAGAIGFLGNQMNANAVPQFQTPGTGSTNFVANQAPQGTPLNQSGTTPLSSFTEPNQVQGIPTQESSLVTPNFSGQSPLPSGFGAESQEQVQIADQSLNSPVQQVPLVAPGNQQATLGNAAVSNQGLVDQLVNAVRLNPSGAPNTNQLNIMNLLGQ